MANSKLLLAAVNDSVAVLRVVGPDHPPHVEADQEHHDEVDQQRHGDHQHVERPLHDLVALQAEHHDDREQQGDQRDRADLRDEDFVSYHVCPLDFSSTSRVSIPAMKGMPR